MRIYRYNPTPSAFGRRGGVLFGVAVSFLLPVPWVLPTVMHILPASGQLRIYPRKPQGGVMCITPCKR
ncbi:MAG: hypothetical protein FWD49_06040 [Firmicutes bacterium]|nr:hypothetical protein [Bacillota bacterium]